MKKQFQRAVSAVLAAACVVSTPLSSISTIFAAEDIDNKVVVTKDNNVVRIGNEDLQREFSIANNKLTTTKIKNLLGKSEFIPNANSEEFVIKTLGSQSSDSTKLVADGTCEGGHDVDNAIDGSTADDNYWCSKENQPFITVDFEKDTEVKTINYVPRHNAGAGYDCTGRATKLNIQYWDGSDWQDLGDFTLESAKEKAPEAIVLDEKINTTKIKLTAKESYFWNDSGRNKHFNIGELDILNEAGESVIVKPTIVGATTIKTSELTLAENGVKVEDTKGTINEVEKTGKLITFEFEPVTMGTGEATITEKVVMYDGDHFMRKFLEISCEDKNVRIDYIDGEHLVVDNNDITWTIPKGKGGVVQMEEYKANLGQPIYINGMFLGSEFPETDTQIEDNLGHIRYFTGKNFTDFARDGQLTEDGTYVSWQTVVGASHTDGSDKLVLQTDFYDYIDSIATPTEFRLLYNSWFDNMMLIDDERIIASFTEMEKELTQVGIRPMDTYAVDDGWNNYHDSSIFDVQRSGTTLNTDGFWTFNTKFPEKLYPSSALVQSLGSELGVWIGPRGGYNYYGQLANIIAAAGNGSKAGGSIDVADSRYVENFEKMAIEFMTEYGVNYWKWDGFADIAQYNHFPSGEGVVGFSETNQHMYGGPHHMYHVTDLWEKWIVLMENVRAAQKDLGIEDLWISLTCYTNPSPWFLQWANSVWLQCVADRGEISNATLNNKMDNMLTYRDANYYDFAVSHDFQFPLGNLYNHDAIYGREGTGITANSMTPEQFKNYLYMMATRGNALFNLYFSDSLLDSEKYLITADLVQWAEENHDILRNAKMIGGNPSANARLSNLDASGEKDTYGFACFANSEGIISMRNPAATAKTITFTLNDAIGVNNEGTYYMSVEHAYSPTTIADAKDTYTKGETVTITLQPGETQIWNMSQTKDTTAPSVYRVDNLSATKVQVQTSEKLGVTAEFSAKVNGKEVATTTTASADCRTFYVTFDAALNNGDKVELVATAGKDVAGNALEATVETTYYTNNKVVDVDSISEDGKVAQASNSLTGINSFTLTANVKTDDKDVVLLQQGDEYKLGIDKDGYFYFTLNNTTVKSSVKVSSEYEQTVSAVRENNGLIRIYVDGQLQNSVYKAENKDYVVKASDIVANKVNGTVSTVGVYTIGLGYDEVPTSELGELVKKLTAEKELYTRSSWIDADMDALLSAAKEASASLDREAMAEAKANLEEAMTKLVLMPKLDETTLINKDANSIKVENYSSQCGGDGEPSENGYGQASATIDYNNASYWHSNYWNGHNGENHTITYDLGQEYTLTDVLFLSRQGSHNGDIRSFEVYVGNDTNYENNTKTGEYVFTDDKLDSSVWNRALVQENGTFTGRYVTIRVTGSYGDSGNNLFASMAEIRFYGTNDQQPDAVDKTALEKVIADAEAKLNDASKYTEETVADLQAALDTANEVLAKEDATKEEVADTIKALTDAINALVENKVVDKTELGKLINAADEKLNDFDKYTKESLDNLEEVLDAAIEVMGNKDATQEQVDAAKADLQEAIDNLVEKTHVDKTKLDEAIAEAERVNTENKTEESKAVLASAIASATAILNKEDATQEEVDAAIAALTDAINGLENIKTKNPVLINTEENKTIVSVVEASSEAKGDEGAGLGTAEATLDYVENTYWHSNWKDASVACPQYITYDLGYEFDLAQIRFLPRQGSQWPNGDIFQVKVYVSSDADFSDDELVGTYDFENNGTYLNDRSWHTIELEASGRYVKFLVTKSGGDTASDKFVSMSEIRFYAEEGTVVPTPDPKPEVNKSELEKAIAWAEKLNKADYTDESVKALEEALSAAKEVLANEEATQDEVFDATKALNDATTALVEKPVVNKAELEKAIDEAGKVDTTNKTAESVAALTSAITSAKEVLADEKATQDAVDAAVKALNDAVANLKDVEVKPEYKGYDDVDSKAWYADMVKEATIKGLMGRDGNVGNNFNPDGKITRGMVATVIYRMAGEPKVTYADKFSDVKDGLWYSESIVWASEAKVVSGYANGKFGPDDAIKREDFAIMLRNYAKACGLDTKSNQSLETFKDYKAVSAYAKDAIAWCVENGLMSGSKKGEETYLNPGANTTRAEAAKMFVQLSNLIKK